MKYNYLILALSAAALCSCSGNLVETPVNDGETITIRAYQEGATETRTTLIDGGTQVYWEPADEIKVFFNGSGGRFAAQNTENVTVATFSGSLPVVVGANEGAGASTKTWGLYPYRADAVLDGDALVTTLPASQTARAESFAKNMNITVAQSKGYDLAFFNVCGGVRFSLMQEGVKEVVFEGQNDESIAGKVKLAFADGVPAVQEVLEGQKTITLTAPNGGTFETGQWYYIVALPGTLTNGFKMTFNTATQYATLKSSGSKTIKRGIFGSLADADEDLIYKDKGGSDPNPTDAIQFADPIAKYACVEKFDTNGDGEVSYAEAAAATSLSGLFAEWNTVTNFDEIQYFTGVTSTNNVFNNCSKLTNITIPDWITTLGSFQGCSSLETVVLPAALNELPAYCFDGCSALTDVTLPSGITAIPNSCFRNCSKLTALALPSTVTSIGTYAYSGCSKLASMVLPDNISSIPSYCFQNCSSLATITWPSSLISIGESAFAGCRFEGVDYTLELPSSVTSIGGGAFGHIHHLVIPSTSFVSIAANSFVQDYTFVYVPDNMVEMYKVRTSWSNYKACIMPISCYPGEWTVGGAVGETIDLGLSVKWSSWNLGASAPEEYGSYFAWGETEPKWDYDWAGYEWCNGSENTLTKYNTSSNYGIVDNKTSLEPEDDAAHVHWGGTWRMPTDTEFTELREECTWEWTSMNGINGRKVTGPNGNSIFLPAAGIRDNPDFWGAGSVGYCWTSSLKTNDPNFVWIVYFGSSDVRRAYGYYRSRGLSIRPVSE